ncbi:MAG: hypothetical protein LJE56_04690 [Acidiferrobacterales bacterium]|jgi:hypothetical protein|nr:hypothetical protein [Acidiferrobacterales bacterium]
MSSKDKTRQKLVGSMRKTKADAGIGTENADETKASPDLPEPKPPKQPAAREPKRESTKPVSAKGDSYQSGRRVWPD